MSRKTTYVSSGGHQAGSRCWELLGLPLTPTTFFPHRKNTEYLGQKTRTTRNPEIPRRQSTLQIRKLAQEGGRNGINTRWVCLPRARLSIKCHRSLPVPLKGPYWPILLMKNLGLRKNPPLDWRLTAESDDSRIWTQGPLALGAELFPWYHTARDGWNQEHWSRWIQGWKICSPIQYSLLHDARLPHTVLPSRPGVWDSQNHWKSGLERTIGGASSNCCLYSILLSRLWTWTCMPPVTESSLSTQDTFHLWTAWLIRMPFLLMNKILLLKTQRFYVVSGSLCPYLLPSSSSHTLFLTIPNSNLLLISWPSPIPRPQYPLSNLY